MIGAPSEATSERDGWERVVSDGPVEGVRLGLARASVLTWRLLLPRERRSAFFLAVLMGANGLLQSVSLAAYLPLITLLVNPTAIDTNRLLSTLHSWVGRPEPTTFAILMGIGFLVIVVAQELLGLVERFWTNRLGARVEERVTTDLLARCLAAPYVWFLSRNRAVLAKEIMVDVPRWSRTFLKGILSLSSSVITLVSVVVFLAVLNPVFGAATLAAWALVTLGTLRVMRPLMMGLSRLQQDATANATRILNHALVGTKDVKITGKEAFFLGEFARYIHVNAETKANAANAARVPGAVINVARGLAVVLVVVYLSTVGSASRAELLTVLAVYGLATVRLLPVFGDVTSTLANIQAAIPSVEAVDRTDAELAALVDDRRGRAMKDEAERGTSTRRIDSWTHARFEGVGFCYPGSRKWALRGVDLTIERGKMYGLVGRSAGGKSTFVDLLAGLLHPSEGAVTIDAHSLEQLDQRVWRSRFGYVSQSPYVADESLRENVAFGIPAHEIDDARVWHCLRVASLAHLPEQLPQGLSTPLGDFGQRLSGGQRQRIAIARALYNRPTILVLDEATSAIDQISESEIVAELEILRGEVTLVVVAHRLSTVRPCDRLFLLEEGRLAGEGTFDELRTSNSIFHRMVATGSIDRDLAQVDGDNARPPVDA